MSEPGTQLRQDPTPKPGFYVLKIDGGITAEHGQVAGPAAIGVVLKDHKYRDVDELSKRIGRLGTIMKRSTTLSLPWPAVTGQIESGSSDSALVVNTVNGD
jgi:hypothetical protein